MKPIDLDSVRESVVGTEASYCVFALCHEVERLRLENHKLNGECGQLKADLLYTVGRINRQAELLAKRAERKEES